MQHAIEQRIVEAAAARGVRLVGAVEATGKRPATHERCAEEC